ncbi:MAG TPA: hypothetical protein VHQ00_16770 [Chloroflexota bacterium]|nr:hypothetical protein [Chloroflexota bacterium]
MRVPRWVWWGAGVAVLVFLLGGLGYLTYGALDRLYPQGLWRYFRPVPGPASGSILYRHVDGYLLLAPVADPGQAQRLSPEAPEIVRDAVFLSDGKAVAYIATDRRSGQPETEHLKVVGLDGAVRHDLVLGEAAGEPLLPTLYVSRSGRYLALTSRDRGHVYYFDTVAGGPLAQGQPESPPEPVLWHRNGDLRQAPFAGQAAYALSPDGRVRAQVRAGERRAPACGEAECEAVSELAVTSQTVTGLGQGGYPLYGVFSSVSAEGWGPLPAQPAARFYGRLVWSPDGRQLLFTTLDGAESRVFAIGVDGRTRPRLVLDGAEALDWAS